MHHLLGRFGRAGPGVVDARPAAVLPEPIDEQPALQEGEGVLPLQELRHGSQGPVIARHDGVVDGSLSVGPDRRAGPGEHGGRAVALLERDPGEGPVALGQVADADTVDPEGLVDGGSAELAGGVGLFGHAQ